MTVEVAYISYLDIYIMFYWKHEITKASQSLALISSNKYLASRIITQLYQEKVSEIKRLGISIFA